MQITYIKTNAFTDYTFGCLDLSNIGNLMRLMRIVKP